MGRGRETPAIGALQVFDGQEYRPIRLSEESATLTALRTLLGLEPDGSTLESSSGVLREKDAGTTNAKLADMSADTIKGRANGAGTGAPQDLTAAQVKAILGLATSTTDNAIARYDGTGGNQQNSGVLIDDSNNVATGGNFLAGATTLDADVTNAFSTPRVAMVSDNSAADGFVSIGNGNHATGPHLYGAKTRSTGTNANTVVQSGDELLSMFGFGSDGASYRIGGGIKVVVDGTPGAADMPGRLEFYTTADGAGSTTRRGYFDNAGVLQLLYGLSFGNETLSTYDEGTWTPTISCSGTAGSNTYTTQAGYYTRVGNIVTVYFRVDMSVKDGAMAGNLRVSGLPFTAKNSSQFKSAGAIFYTTNIAFTNQLAMGIGENVTFIELYDLSKTTASSTSALTEASVAAGLILMGSFTYLV